MMKFAGHRVLESAGSPVVMGVLNITPDSFSDGGQFLELDAAVARAVQMAAEGADIIDVGPESSRPGAEPVEPVEQIRRAVPVIEAVRQALPEMVISIDTSSAQVAAAAVEVGADVVNDITALGGDPGMARLVAESGAVVALMHMQGTPDTMQRAPHYADVVTEVKSFLAARADVAIAAGVDPGRIIVDPGIGFGKTVEHNCALIRRLDELVELGFPVLLGASRKSMVRAFVGNEASGILAGSSMCALAGAVAGARIVRVHDVAETVALLRAAAPAVSPRR
ncbi:MAG: dihydropteroate synthase [bacterium]|nr:dihydropteroate synthase [bacterium]